MLLIGPSAVFVSYACLFTHLLRSDAYKRFPAFTLSILVWLLYLPAWVWEMTQPPGLGILPWIQPLLLASQVFAWIEAFQLVTRKLPPAERFWIAAALSTAALICIVRIWGLQSHPYHAVRTYVHVSMAVGGVFVAGWLWIKPTPIRAEVLQHGLILTLYFCGHAIAGIARIAGLRWWMTSAVYSLISINCAALWLLRLESKPRLKHELHVRNTPLPRPLPFVP